MNRGKTVLQGRLKETLILELHKDGTRDFCHMTLRELYSHVIKVVTFGKIKDSNYLPVHQEETTRSSVNDTTVQDNCDSYYIGDSKNISPQPRRPRNVSVSSKSISYRERLGGYLHPRDMRRLVTPFSSTNAPELIVRRHVILMNFDPLRAIVLRDRVIIFVPDGADSILGDLERRLYGGVAELENQIFGDHFMHSKPKSNAMRRNSSNKSLNNNSHSKSKSSTNEKRNLNGIEKSSSNNMKMISQISQETNDEWDEIIDGNWMNDIAFELVAVDAVLQMVCSILSTDATSLIEKVEYLPSNPSDLSHDKLRISKDEVNELEARVQGFIRAIDLVLDEDEDLALMNLSRLVSHPELFVQPVSPSTLQEESDEPELILEAYMQQALTIVNALQFLEHAITSKEELVMMKLDTVRNRLLFINTFLGLASVCIASVSLVASIFGMNLINHYENHNDMFGMVVIGTISSSFSILIFSTILMYRAGLLQ